MNRLRKMGVGLTYWWAALVVACGGDDSTEADRLGVGAQCTTSEDCPQPDNETDPALECLSQFKGGYCGLSDCNGDADCPAASACVAHTDGQNYCFRICTDKSECNVNRDPNNESNCSANIDFVGDPGNVKACVPPSG